VHLAVQPCDLTAIQALARQYGFKVIEDASHAIGARYNGNPVGDCRYSDIAVFSFHPVKIITTAEGGAAVTNDSKLAERMALLRTHGITRDPALMTRQEGDWYYEQLLLGFNYRMTDLQAALGLSQFDRLDDYVASRHAIAARYDSMLADLPVTCPWQHPDGRSAYHLYIVRVPAGRHDSTFASLRQQGVGVNEHYIPVYRQPYFRERGIGQSGYPEAERYYSEAISLPIFATLSEADQAYVMSVLSRALLT
jgi:dTDP-4-amino-4,6-dideoxygalactose transaminase